MVKSGSERGGRALWGLLSLGILLMGVGACTSAISKEVRTRLDPSATFDSVFADAEAYKGAIVLWGGEIIQTRNTKEGTWIELLQRPLGRDDRPDLAGASQGRFLVRHEGFLDPAVYGPGRELTVVGEVGGNRIEPLGEIEYTYPVITDEQLVLWGPRRDSAIQYGVGFGVRF